MPSLEPSPGPDGFDAAWSVASEIEGWLSREQGLALFEAAHAVEPGDWIVEIGSHHGRSTVVLGAGATEASGVLAIDPFLDPPLGRGDAACEALVDNLRGAGLADRVHVFRGTSEQAAECCDLLLEVVGGKPAVAREGVVGIGPKVPGPASVGLVFVDGLHDRNSVLRDAELWEARVAEDGRVYFHDAFFRVGVTLALLQRHLLDYRVVYLGSVGNLAMFRRQPVVGNKAAVRSSLRLLARLGYFGRNMLTTLALRRNWRTLLKVFPPEEDFEY
jgi:hypothetical protein